MKRIPLDIGYELHSDSIVYRIESVLGQGSFGITYKAKAYIVMKGKLGEELVETNTPKAIKEFFMKEVNERDEHGSITGMSEGSLPYYYLKKFKQEAENLANMNHPNIVKVIDFVYANNTYYYVMDYIEGENLNDYLKHHKMSESEATDTIVEIAKALHYMHEEKHMLHLDLKPGNIMRRSSDGHLFLIDFGLSKHYNEEGIPETSTSVGLGTPGYAPIEQGNVKSVKQFRRTLDIYALGATYYKLLTGKVPPSADELVSDKDVIKEELENNHIHSVIISSVLKAMLPNLKERTQNVPAFLSDLTKGNQILETKCVEEVTETTVENVIVEQPACKEDGSEKPTIRKTRKKNNKKTLVFSILVFLCLLAVVFLLSSNRNKYNQDFSSELVKAAKKGDKLAQYWLGDCYYYGRGVSINKDKAFNWYLKAAEQGLDSAQICLANCYSKGEGVEKDINMALSWIKKATSQNNANAISSLGWYYIEGEAVQPDTVKALALFRESVNKGSHAGMRSLGYAYLEGLGVTPDTLKALQWFEKAEKTKKYYATDGLIECYAFGFGDKNDSLKCQNLLFEKIEHVKDTFSLRNTYGILGDVYLYGYDMQSDSIKAFEWYMKAALLQDSYAQFKVGYCYEYGNGVKRDTIEAMTWYMKAANQNDLKSIRAIAYNYEKGMCIKKDETEAFKWYMKTAELDDSRGMYDVGRCYYDGIGVEQDKDKAYYWYLKSAQKGYDEAQNALGDIYDEKQNYKEAFKWYQKAAGQNNKNALCSMGYYYFFSMGVKGDSIKAVNCWEESMKPVIHHVSKRKWYSMVYTNSGAMHNLGVCYENGWGTKKNLKKSQYWYNREKGIETDSTSVSSQNK